MAVVSRFVELEAIRQRIDRCPLAELPPVDDTRACATCRYNLAYPGRAEIGCAVSTPSEVFDRALAEVHARSPALAAELDVLLGESFVRTDDRAARWLRLAQRWYTEARDREDEREVAMVAARFAKAALADGEAVEILR